MGFPVYGGATASSANVTFPFSEMTPAARDLWKMADDVHAAAAHVKASVTTVSQDWTGPQHTTLTGKAAAFATSAASVEEALRYLANELARAWAAARGQQDRINTARYAQAEIEDDGWLENAWEHFAGEDKYPPPNDPGVPSHDGFAPTRSPMHSNFGP